MLEAGRTSETSVYFETISKKALIFTLAAART
jgi:hypothetical protein